MATATRTWGVQETLLDPQALPPPPVRHALLVFLIALTAILHLGTMGWSEIHNGIEGEYAGGARQMLAANTFAPMRHGIVLPAEPPLLDWLLVLSYKLFGVTAVAAHVPTALAMIGSVALTFLIGERLGGYWRGFVAGLIQLCSLGALVLCRISTAEPLFTMLVEGALFCALCGYQARRHRAFWFSAFWFCAALAVLIKGLFAPVFIGSILMLLALMFREARLRFRALLHWSHVLPFVVVVATWFTWSHAHGASSWSLLSLDSTNDDDHGSRRIFVLLLHHLAWWYPAVLLVAPGLLFAWRKVLRPHGFNFADALPLCWIVVGLVSLLFPSQRTNFQLISIWPAFALWSAVAWERTSPDLRIAGIVFAAAAGVALPWFDGVEPGEAAVPAMIPALAIAVGIACLAAAAYLGRGSRERLAICIATLGMLPIGLTAAEPMSRLDSRYSFATAARLMRPRLDAAGEVIYEGSPRSGSSLEFYLARQPLYVAEPSTASTPTNEHAAGRITTEEAVEKFGAANPVLLIIKKERAPAWQDLLTTRYHIYHQVSTCGDSIVVTNQP